MTIGNVHKIKIVECDTSGTCFNTTFLWFKISIQLNKAIRAKCSQTVAPERFSSRILYTHITMCDFHDFGLTFFSVFVVLKMSKNVF